MKRWELIGELESILRCAFPDEQADADLSGDDVEDLRGQLNATLDAVVDVEDVT